MLYYGFIYITTNNLNGKKYIGKRTYTKGWQDYLGSGLYLKRAIKKYGKENFERKIVEYASNREQLDEKEKMWIQKLNAIEDNMFYNIAEGGTGGNVFAGYSEDELKAIHTDEWKNKIGEANKGKAKSEEHKKKISESKKGISTITEEGRSKITQSLIERHKNNEHPLAGRTGAKSVTAKRVLLINENNEIIKQFGCVKEIYGDWRNEYPKPNSMKEVAECLRKGKLFHGLKLISEKDYLGGN